MFLRCSRTGGHHEAREADVVEYVADRASGQADCCEIIAGRIEIEDHPVGVMRPVGACEPRMWRDAGLAREIDNAGGVVAHAVFDLAVFFGQADPRDPAGKVIGGILLVEAFIRDAVGEAVQRQRAVLDVGKHGCSNAAVVIDKIALGDSGIGNSILSRFEMSISRPPTFIAAPSA